MERWVRVSLKFIIFADNIKITFLFMVIKKIFVDIDKYLCCLVGENPRKVWDQEKVLFWVVGHVWPGQIIFFVMVYVWRKERKAAI